MATTRALGPGEKLFSAPFQPRCARPRRAAARGRSRQMSFPARAWRRRLLAALAAAALAGAVAQTCPRSSASAVVLDPQEVETGAPGTLMFTDVRWLGADTGFVLALTAGGHLWRSVNGGLTWADDTPRLLGAAQSGGVASLVVLNTAPARVLIFGGYNASAAGGAGATLLWATQNHGARLRCVPARSSARLLLPPTIVPNPHIKIIGPFLVILPCAGYTYEQPCELSRGATDCVTSPSGGLLVSVKPHPRAPDVVAALTRTRSCFGISSSCVRQDVWTTTDFARTWSSALAHAAQGGSTSAVVSFIDFDWSPEAWAPPAAGAQPSNAIIASAYLSAADQLNGLYWSGFWDKGVHTVVSRDLFKTRAVVRRCGNDFRVMSDGRVRACARAAPSRTRRPFNSHWRLTHIRTRRQIYLGVAGGCDLPASATDGWAVTLEVSANNGSSWSVACFPSREAEHSYTLYDLGDAGGAFVNVDHSDTRDPVRQGQPLGVLYHADAGGTLFSLSRRDVVLQPTGVSDFVPADGLPGVAFANSVDPELWKDPDFLSHGKTAYEAITSRVSRDAGASWAALPTPAPLPGRQQCSGDAATCAFHVHGPDASWRGSFNASYAGLYTAAGAPGVVWATGSVSRHLSYAPQDVRTFVSQDGGASWATVADSSQIYETGASGGLLVMAPYGPAGAATSVAFSVDGGACWNSVQLRTPMQVHNIQTRPDNAGTLFIMHGVLSTTPPKLGIYVLDFGALLPPAEVPTCTSADYEAWSPDGCGRGATAIFERRKPHARCLPAPGWKAQRVASRPCGCAATDYECAYGYERRDGAAGGECVKMVDFAIDAGCPDVAAAPTRLIAGDVCTASPPGGGGRSGSRGKKGGLSGAAIFFIVVLVLSVVGAAALFVARLLGLPLPPALAHGVDDAISAVRSGYGRLKGVRPLASEDEAWLDSPDAAFAPLAGSYEPPR